MKQSPVFDLFNCAKLQHPICSSPVVSVTLEQMDLCGSSYPKAFSHPTHMANLAESAHTLAGVEGIYLPFNLCIEAEALCHKGFSTRLPGEKIGHSKPLSWLQDGNRSSPFHENKFGKLRNMEDLFKPIQNTKMSDRIIKQFEELIHGYKLKPGDRLPSERELTDLFKVGRPTIREALRSLELIGLIEVKQGRGSFIKEIDFISYIASLRENVNFTRIVDTVSLEEYYSGRKLIEPAIARVVAEKHSSEDLEQLDQIIRDTRMALNDEGGQFNKFSAIFHEVLAKMTRNKVIQFSMDFILTMSSKARLQLFAQKDFRTMVLKDHERIVKLIREGDGKGAEQEIERHLDNLYRENIRK
ncbi:MAG: GntR family transcriptional regulator [Deltaproteobacteria bacterium]|nr:GntR family transcriptional regulator [Deltaproteobacteria bacterium]